MRYILKVSVLIFAFGLFFAGADAVSAQSLKDQRKARREYRKDLREARKDYRKDLRKEKDLRKARRDFRKDRQDARKDYRKRTGNRY